MSYALLKIKRQENGDNEILLDYQMQIINNKKIIHNKFEII